MIDDPERVRFAAFGLMADRRYYDRDPEDLVAVESLVRAFERAAPCRRVPAAAVVVAA